MEKLFFKITRWLMLVGASIAFLVLIFGTVYALKLYATSKDTYVKKELYQPKDPSVSFETFKKMHESKIDQAKKEKAKIASYVSKVIGNGSEGHGYPLGSMPGKLIRGKDAEAVAHFIANRLKGSKPAPFAACTACHGEDGEGLGGQAPSLLTLPIYNGLVGLKKADRQNTASLGATVPQQRYDNPLKTYSAKLANLINRYALIVGQQGATINGIYRDIKQLSNTYDDSTFALLQAQMEENLQRLLHYGKSLEKEKKNLDDAIDWKAFINWVVESFNQQRKAEREKHETSWEAYQASKQRKLSQAQAAEFKLLQVGAVLGGALIIFILLTMILVLFQIEINTRPKA